MQREGEAVKKEKNRSRLTKENFSPTLGFQQGKKKVSRNANSRKGKSPLAEVESTKEGSTHWHANRDGPKKVRKRKGRRCSKKKGGTEG